MGRRALTRTAVTGRLWRFFLDGLCNGKNGFFYG